MIKTSSAEKDILRRVAPRAGLEGVSLTSAEDLRTPAYWAAAPRPAMLLHKYRTLMRRGRVIARIWHGWAPRATADGYQRHFETQVGAHLQGVDGFLGACLLRRADGAEVLFTSIAWFSSLDAVRGFAGTEYEQAVVEDAATQLLSSWDDRVSHHDVVADVRQPRAET